MTIHSIVEESTPVVTRPSVLPVPPAPRRRDRSEAIFGLTLIMPMVLGWICVVAVPIVMVVQFSLQNRNSLSGTVEWAGFSNYQRLLTDPEAIKVLAATLIYSVGLVAINLLVALGLAVLLNRKLFGRTAFRTAFFSPMVVSLVAWSVVWQLLLRDDGSVNGVLAQLGIEGPNWLREPTPAMISVIVVQMLKGVGLNMILFLAALQAVPTELKEAAALDGATARQSFWRIQFPMISPTVLLASIITVLGSLQAFSSIKILTAGGPGNSTDVVAFYIYRQGFERHELGYASAWSMVMFAAVLTLTLIQWRLRGRWVHDG